MSRPYTDITLAKSNKPIKNGAGVVGVGFTAKYSTLDTNVSVNPTILTIQNKYGDRFYNGTMVYVLGGVDGGGASTGGINITPVTTNAPTNTPTASVTPTSTPMSTGTATPTNTSTPTNSSTSGTTATPTNTLTATPSSSSTSPEVTPTNTPTTSTTSTLTATPTSTVTVTPSSSSGAIHAEALDWQTRVIDNGGSVNNTTLNAVSDFCKSIDNLGIRDRFYRLNLMCGNNISASLVPLYRSFAINNSIIGGSTDININLLSSNYIETGATGGISGGGAGTALNSTIQASLLEDVDNFHFACYVFGTPYTDYNKAIMGSDGTYDGVRSRLGFSIPPSSANDTIRAYAIKDTAGIDYSTNGLICGNLDSGSLTIYAGSSGAINENYSATTSTAIATSLDIYLLGLRLGGSNSPSASLLNTSGISYYSIGRKLTSLQYTQLYNTITTFQTILGRNQ